MTLRIRSPRMVVRCGNPPGTAWLEYLRSARSKHVTASRLFNYLSQSPRQPHCADLCDCFIRFDWRAVWIGTLARDIATGSHSSTARQRSGGESRRAQTYSGWDQWARVLSGWTSGAFRYPIDWRDALTAERSSVTACRSGIQPLGPPHTPRVPATRPL